MPSGVMDITTASPISVSSIVAAEMGNDKAKRAVKMLANLFIKDSRKRDLCAAQICRFYPDCPGIMVQFGPTTDLLVT